MTQQLCCRGTCNNLLRSDHLSLDYHKAKFPSNGRTNRKRTIIPINVECKPSGYISMLAKCRPFPPSDLSAIPKPKSMGGWTDGRMLRMTTIPTGILVDLAYVIWLHSKFYAIPSKWFVRKCTESWKCGEQMDGQTGGRTIIPISVDKLRVSHTSALHQH